MYSVPLLSKAGDVEATEGMTNNEKLKEFMQNNKLSQADVADMTGYSLDSVKAWCARPTSKRYREMEPRALRSLQRELQLRKT